MKILLVPYNPEWPRTYEEEKSSLATDLNSLKPSIEHIGSTAVEGMSAKPVIDIMIGLQSQEQIAQAVELLQQSGYIYVRKFENDTLQDRKFMIRVENASELEIPGMEIPEEGSLPDMEKFPRRSHIHLVEYDSKSWKSHLLFRDYLRNHPEAAQEYIDIKSNLAEQDWKESTDYARSKGDFVRKIESLARAEFTS